MDRAAVTGGPYRTLVAFLMLPRSFPEAAIRAARSALQCQDVWK